MRPGQVHTDPRPGQARTCNPLVFFAQNVCSVECFAPGGFKGVAQAATKATPDADAMLEINGNGPGLRMSKEFILSNDVAD
jgi:hypothetical protein